MKNLPNHVAIIMDGNTRWAENQNLDKSKGHKEGVKKARLAVEFFLEKEIDNLTLFAFSTENWGREEREVKALLKLFLEAINEQTPDLVKNKVKLNFIGEISRFDKVLMNKIKNSQIKTSQYDPKMNLNIAISYGGRWDIEQALKKIIKDLLKNKIKIKNLSEDLISNYLSTSSIPDPDLIIRSAGEQRISNFFLWQAAYSEMYFIKKLWPDFIEKDFQDSLDEFSLRKRKFGVETGA
ncbi:MAG: di-trans,poly-cis-decaprenylcistransferase [Gammaproteobacteria bacterium TMED222]|jgi:undecaprenyl diphosphate synthase|nr:polyprenyl diphosphate synthase [SAR86 cluster bacterium]OUW81767.1 MAG: di-trans,poly-cis-decaprenylcistransferase [Gammaproteobacteria bacterium TMED222]RZP01480.1 MAG: di-trans,poly-cis-decaprenylcistransferase [Gammaproteobacteria bacterium]|tara:strand:- start:2105 stop:2818 length:714 start_codon:yes stop_codon:yes gene_type:complete